MIPKFRAWDKLNKGMCDVANIDFMTKVVELRHDIPFYFLPFSEVVLMQSTGLKDKNGVEIFEGDILYFEPYETHSNDRVVEHIDGAYHGRLIRNGYSKLLAECVYETKVIGNIYENTELLEETE